MWALAGRLLWTAAVAASVTGYPEARVGRVLPIYAGGDAAGGSGAARHAFSSAISAFGLSAVQIVEPAGGGAPIDDGLAAGQARQAGAAFALVATPTEVSAQGGAAAVSLLKLTLIRSDDGSRRDAAVVRVADSDALMQAVSGMLGQAAQAPALSLSPASIPPAAVERPTTGWRQITFAATVVAVASLFVWGILRAGNAQAADRGIAPAEIRAGH
jgi:hypothetical protein